MITQTLASFRWPVLLMVGLLTAPTSLVRGQCFRTTADYAVGSNPTWVAMGDFNGDNKPDLAVANPNSNTVSVLLSNAGGTLNAAVDYPVVDVPRSVAVGDFNGDGKADLATANGGSNTVSVLLNGGNGSFQPAVGYASGGVSVAVAVGDFNADGKLDLTVATSGDGGGGGASVLLGKGDGTFQDFVSHPAGSGPLSVAVGDFNADGKLDLATANSGDNTVSVLLNGGNGSFQPAVGYGVGTFPASVAVGDLNGDGKADLATANATGNTVSVLLNNGDGTFGVAQPYGVGTRPSSVAVGDFNGDGKADLATANATGNTVSVLLNAGNGAFQPASDYGVDASPASVAVGDFNGDTELDLAVASAGDNAVSVLLNGGDGSLGALVRAATGKNPTSVGMGDFNGDGNPDLATANATGNSVSVLLGYGNGTFQPAVEYAVGNTPYSLVVADFNGDGKPDLAVTNLTDDTVSVLFNDGNGTFQAPQNHGVGNQPVSVTVGDFNGDGKPDLATANATGNSVSVLLNAGNGAFQPAVNYEGFDQPNGIASGDFNGDGKLDLAVTNANGNRVSVLMAGASGAFQPAVDYTAGGGPVAVAVGDFNGDTKPDLAVVNQTNATSPGTLLLNDGNGAFQPQSGGFNGFNACIWVGVTDFNGDGKDDLILTHTNNDFVVGWAGAGNGTLWPGTVYEVGGGQAAGAVGDLNGDGKPDLAVPVFDADRVAVLLSVPPIQLTVTNPSPRCPGETLDLASTVRQFAPVGGTFSYFERTANGELDFLDSSTVNPTTTTRYVIQYQVGGCFEFEEVTATVGPGTIAAPTVVGVPACPGGSVALTFTSTCPVEVKAYLSDASGNFPGGGTALGAVVSGGRVTIPLTTPPGAGYRIRLVSTELALVSDSSAAFGVTALAVAPSPTTPARICQRDALAVTFGTAGNCPFPVGNVFTVQLSGATGSFANPTALGTAQPGTTSFALPQNLPVGTGYRVRVVSSNPAQVSPASLPFRVEGPSLSGVTPAVGGVPVCRGQAVTVSFGLPGGSCAFPENNQFTAQLSSATGSFNNPTSLGVVLAGVSNSVTIPAGVGAGTGYRIRVVSSSPALSSPNSAPFQVRACATRMSAADPEFSGSLVVAPNPVQGGNAFPGEIRVRVSGLDNPDFTLFNGAGRSLGLRRTSGVYPGEFTLRPMDRLPVGVYLLQASEGPVRMLQRVVVVE